MPVSLQPAQLGAAATQEPDAPPACSPSCINNSCLTFPRLLEPCCAPGGRRWWLSGSRACPLRSHLGASAHSHCAFISDLTSIPALPACLPESCSLFSAQPRCCLLPEGVRRLFQPRARLLSGRRAALGVAGGGSCRSPPGGAGSGPLAPGPSLSAPLFALRCVWLSQQLFPPLEEGAVSLDRRCDALWPRQTWSLSEHPVSAPPARVPGGAEGGRVRAPAQRSATASHGLAAMLGTFIVPAALSAEAA